MIPRYLSLLSVRDGRGGCSLRIEDVVPCTSSLHGVAFININFHLPGKFPLGYRI